MNPAIRIIVELIKANMPDKLKVHPDLLLYLPNIAPDSPTYVQITFASVYYAPGMQTLAVKVNKQGKYYHYTKLIT